LKTAWLLNIETMGISFFFFVVTSSVAESVLLESSSIN
jgi:hypothetical protein